MLKQEKYSIPQHSAFCDKHRWYDLIEPIQGKYARVCLSCNWYQYRDDLSLIWKDYND